MQKKVREKFQKWGLHSPLAAVGRVPLIPNWITSFSRGPGECLLACYAVLAASRWGLDSRPRL